MAHPLITRRSLVRALGVVGAGGLLGAVAACGAGPSSRTPSAPASTADASGTAPQPADTLSPVDLASVPAYDYRAHDVAVVSQGESMDGRLYVPDTDAAVPLVVCSHGLGGSMSDLDPVAQALAGVGMASYCFAFRGGGPAAGDTTRMSVMTEVTDLEAVLETARTGAGEWESVDPQRIVLQGVSQGGAVSAITASRHPQEVAGLALWYPAFSIADDLHLLFDSLDEVPESYDMGPLSLGRVYVEDMWDYDVYAELPSYASPVLLVHGSADALVPINYSRQAVQTYPDAQLVTIDGAGHGFSEAAWDQAVGTTAAYLQQIGVLGA
ncbi:alpha/beta hydrolase family protein [Actinomyces oricola]